MASIGRSTIQAFNVTKDSKQNKLIVDSINVNGVVNTVVNTVVLSNVHNFSGNQLTIDFVQQGSLVYLKLHNQLIGIHTSNTDSPFWSDFPTKYRPSSEVVISGIKATYAGVDNVSISIQITPNGNLTFFNYGVPPILEQNFAVYGFQGGVYSVL